MMLPIYDDEEYTPYPTNKKSLTAAEKAAAEENLAAAESAEKYWRELETRPCYRTKNARERAFRWGSNAYLASVFAYLALQGQDVELADIKTFCDAGYIY